MIEAGGRDGRAAAEAAGLRYAHDDEPGFGRRRCGTGWSYKDTEGETIRDPGIRARLEALAIPPAWTEVWICPDPEGHLLATGRDDAGRKQYIYHPRWREARNRKKFSRLVGFGRALPHIRERVQEALAREEPGPERVLAAVVRLLETTFVRIGSEKYQRANGSYGLATLRERHVETEGIRLTLSFPGKGGADVEASVADPRVAEVVRECRDTGTEKLFAWTDADGTDRPVSADDVNAYIRDLAGSSYTAKDFRTWAGSLYAFIHLCRMGGAADEEEAEAHCIGAVDEAAHHLRNTRSVAREFYVHPGVLESYREGWFRPYLKENFGGEIPDHLDPAESALLTLLEAWEARTG